MMSTGSDNATFLPDVLTIVLSMTLQPSYLPLIAMVNCAYERGFEVEVGDVG